jgi:hypothetical protein
MMSLLLLGFLIGMRHALEADHVAAVASLATRSPSIAHAVKQGAFWGLGHTLTLFIFGSIVIWMDTIMPEKLAQGLELAVGVMLIFLGADVFRRMFRERVHFHSHFHRDGAFHFHAHAHAGEQGHDPQRHEHVHQAGFPLRALLVGLMHGMAGSAALILLTLQTVRSPATGMIYILVFGVGSILGMAALSAIIVIPLHKSAKRLTWLHNGLQAVIGMATILFGTAVIYEVGIVEGLLTM